MSGNGSIRRIGEIGRVVLPAELRKALDWKQDDRLEITQDGDRVILRRIEERCCFCGGETRLKEYRGKLICGKCVEKIREL